MKPTCPLERLTPEEAKAARDIIDREGKRRALVLLGMRDLCALMTAAAGFAAHRLTIITIRAALRDAQPKGDAHASA